MNIVITGTGFSFPEGTGASTRVMEFAKGMMSNGAFVNILCPKPTESKETGKRNIDLKGVYEGIPFEYTCGQRKVADSRVGALFLYLKGLLYACLAINRIHKRKPVDAILIWYAERPLNFIFFSLLAKLIGAVLIAEKSEYPFVYMKKTLSVRFKLMFYERITLKVVDGVIVISTFLQEYFVRHMRNRTAVIKIPIIVDTSLYPEKTKYAPKSHTIIYCGNLDHHGEVMELLQSFSRVANEYTQWSLDVIGPLPNVNVMNTLKSFVVDNGLKGRVTFFGAVLRSEIPSRLIRADIMTLPRASGVFSSAGFPTKLGEYLATGNPVVVTDTGDIGEYLLDNKNAYLVIPDDVDAFSHSLRYVISHYDEAIKVGEEGRLVALREFDSKTQSRRLLSFIHELYVSKS